MNLLIDEVPVTIEIDSKEYEINTNFRESILFELLMQDHTVPDKEKMVNALGLYFPIIPDDIKQAVEVILWFYKCGRENQDKNSEDAKVSNKAEMIYSFDHDDEYIYSAFLDQYNIDLQDIDSLHWWKFRALFKGLKEDNQISKIMRYRAIKITDDMSDTEKKYYREMKELYALPDNRTQEEKEDDFSDSIANLL